MVAAAGATSFRRLSVALQSFRRFPVASANGRPKSPRLAVKLSAKPRRIDADVMRLNIELAIRSRGAR